MDFHLHGNDNFCHCDCELAKQETIYCHIPSLRDTKVL
jgi:hypothetical protein